jgi:hypothetical protein
MAQYAVLIYAGDSAHAPDATPDDLRECDDHASELAAGGSMVAAYALVVHDGGGVEIRPVHSGGVTGAGEQTAG